MEERPKSSRCLPAGEVGGIRDSYFFSHGYGHFPAKKLTPVLAKSTGRRGLPAGYGIKESFYSVTGAVYRLFDLT
jgi:hypothetical protein